MSTLMSPLQFDLCLFGLNGRQTDRQTETDNLISVCVPSSRLSHLALSLQFPSKPLKVAVASTHTGLLQLEDREVGLGRRDSVRPLKTGSNTCIHIPILTYERVLVVLQKAAPTWASPSL